MLVKAKWNVKDAAGWHKAGEVFETSDNLGEAVILVGEPRKPVIKEPKDVPAEEPEAEPVKEPEAEPVEEQPVRSRTRRKTTTK